MNLSSRIILGFDMVRSLLLLSLLYFKIHLRMLLWAKQKPLWHSYNSILPLFTTKLNTFVHAWDIAPELPTKQWFSWSVTTNLFSSILIKIHHRKQAA